MGYRTGRKKSQRRRISLTSRVGGGVTSELRSKLRNLVVRSGELCDLTRLRSLNYGKLAQSTHTKSPNLSPTSPSLLRRGEEEEGSIQFGRIFTRR